MAAILLLGCLAGCNSEKKQQELEESVHTAIYGAWVYYDPLQNARYTYLIDHGVIEQQLKVTDDKGEELDLSLGDTFSIRYKVVAENEIAIYSTVAGQETETESVMFEKVDDNTLVLDGVTYTRYEEWVKTHPE